MKLFQKYIAGLISILALTGVSACQDDFEGKEPGFQIPSDSAIANISILDLKKLYWQDAVNYIDTIRTRGGGGHYIISGRVVSSDRAGNVYKKLVIQDETGALAISVNRNSLFNDYRIGQEIVIDATGMYIGKYNGTQQLGFPLYYEKNDVWEATFMPYEFFTEHAALNGLPEPAKIDTIVIRNFSELPSDPSELAAIQSQLVRFNNVYFADGGVKEFTDGYKITTNRLLYDKNGQSITVRTSGYSTFREEMLPEGHGDVVALIDYYATSADAESPWQLTLIDAAGCMNFGNPTMDPGDKDNPYTVGQAIALEQADNAATGWLTGYIVGAVAPEVTSVSSNADIEWGDSEVVLANTLVIGPTPECKDFSECVVIYLEQDSPLRSYGNLRDNPGNYKKQIWLYGTFEKYMDTWGITGNNGSASQFRIEGVEVGGGEIPDGNGQESSPYSVAQVIAMNPSSTTAAVQSGVWVEGYIVGTIPTGGASTVISGMVFGTDNAAASNLVIAPTADCTDYTKCITVQLVSGSAVRSGLNLVDHPGNLGALISVKGDVMKYCGGPGLKTTTDYKIISGGSGDNPNPPSTGSGSGTESDPYDAIAAAAAATAGSTAEVYVTGTISQIKEVSTSYGNASYYISADGTAAGQFYIFRGYYLNGAKFTAEDQIKVGDKVLVKGSLTTYNGSPQLAQGNQIITLNGSGSGDNPDPDKPDTPVTGNSADFNTFNGGEANTMNYGEYTTADGWKTTWSLILAGGTEATNFVSTDPKFLFPCIDGTPKRPGTLTSPTIAGGVKKLTFSYGFPYSESKVQFTVNIRQGDAVVASDVVLADPATKATVFNYSHDFNVTGDCVIEIVNDCITQASGNNKDRLAVWNLTWTK